MNTLDIAFTRLIHPAGILNARFIGAIDATGSVLIRYWDMDPKSGRNKPAFVVARYCYSHCICYRTTDYPGGCPECGKEPHEKD